MELIQREQRLQREYEPYLSYQHDFASSSSSLKELEEDISMKQEVLDALIKEGKDI